MANEAAALPPAVRTERAGGPRFRPGFGWGVVATVAMSIPTIAGAVAGIVPMPRPMLAAIVGIILEQGLPRPLLIALAVSLPDLH